MVALEGSAVSYERANPVAKLASSVKQVIYVDMRDEHIRIPEPRAPLTGVPRSYETDPL